MNFPYKEYKSKGNKIRRIFNENVNSEELVWHRDREDRVVEIIESSDWKIQFDNKIPQKLEKGDFINIKKNEYHRVIKGNGNLIVDIIKLP
jgi:hypothetical protein